MTNKKNNSDGGIMHIGAEEAANFAKLIKNGIIKAGTVVRVGPEGAGVLIENGWKNRKVRQGRVEEYAALQLHGLFPMSDLHFYLTGDMVNGFHRMHALKKSGVTALFRVYFVTPEEARDGLDGGIPRSLQDRIGLFKPRTTHVTHRAAATTVCARLLTANVAIRSLRDFDVWYAFFKDGLDFAVPFFCATRGLMSGSVISGACAFAYKADPRAVEKFATEIRDGQNLKPGSPALAFRRTMELNRNGRRQKDDGLGQSPQRGGRKAKVGRGIIARRLLSCLYADMNGQYLQKTALNTEAVRFFAEAYSEQSKRALFQKVLPFRVVEDDEEDAGLLQGQNPS